MTEKIIHDNFIYKNIDSNQLQSIKLPFKERQFSIYKGKFIPFEIIEWFSENNIDYNDICHYYEMTNDQVMMLKLRFGV